MIELKQLQIENFLSIGQARVPLNNQGLVLVRGVNNDSNVADSNGAGKSAIFEALLWALFGRTYRGLIGDDVVNRKVGRDCAVGLSFSLSSQDCEVLRFRKFGKEGSGLALSINGVDKSRPTMPETQKELERLLGFGYESFTNAVYFGQSLAHFSSLTDSQQKKVLEELLGLSVLPKSLAIVRERLKELSNENIKLDTQQKLLEKEKAEGEKRVRELEEIQAKQKQEKQQAISGIEDEKKLAKLELEKVKAVSKRLQEQFKVMNKGFLEKESTNQKETRKAEMELQKASAVLTNLSKRAADLTAVEVPYCPYIKAECALEKERLEKESESISRELICQRRIVQQYGVALKKLRKEEETLEWEKKKLKKKEAEADSAVEDVGLLERHIESLNQKLAEAKKETSAVTELERLLSNECKKLRTRKVNLTNNENTLRRLTHQRKLLEFWEVGFGNAGVKSYMMDSVAEILNERVHEFTKFLTDGEFGVTFQTQSTLKSGEIREKFDISIIGQSGETSYAATSGGERRRIDICILLALSELTGLHGNLPNLLFLDEVFDHLDKEGMNRVIALLRSKLLEKRESIFVVTFSEALSNYFERELLVVKESGISKVNFVGV